MSRTAAGAWVLCFEAILLFLFPAITTAADAKSSALAGAFAAVSDDPSAMASNPAGLTQLRGTHIYGGVMLINLADDYESPSGQTEKSDPQTFYAPSLNIATDLGSSDVRFGVGFFSPFGIGGTKWSSTGLTRYDSTESIIGTFMINPTVAYQISPSLSAGAGVDYMVARSKSRVMVDQSAAGGSDGEIASKADGDGWGYNMGVLFAASDRLSFGLAYRSEIKVDYKGDLHYSDIAPALQPLFGGSEFSTPMRTATTFPASAAFGIKYLPAEKIMLSFELERVWYSSFDKMNVDLENEVPAAGFTDSSKVFDWRDLWRVKLGLEYKATEQLALRAGYAYWQKAIPDHTLDAAVVDGNKHTIATGLGYKMERTVLDFYYVAQIMENRTVTNPVLSGKYGGIIQYAGFGIGYKF